MIYALLTGEFPFKRDEIAMNATPQIDWIDPSLMEIINLMLAKEEENRPDATQLLISKFFQDLIFKTTVQQRVTQG